MKTIKEKIAALQEFTSETVKYNADMNEFETGSATYKVFTDEEADKAAAEEIKNSLWAFIPQFILEHTKVYRNLTNSEQKTFCDALGEMQAKLCESANPLVEALIEDIEEFIYDAIAADGRGHFIAWYDFEENEQDDFYIYRVD